MENLPANARRDFIKKVAAVAAVVPALTATSALAQQVQAAKPLAVAPTAAPTTLAEVPLDPSTRLTIERRGQVAILGLNRPHVQNRLDPETFQALARALYDYDNDPSLRAAVLFGHGDCFSRGIDVEAYRAVARLRTH